MPGTKIIGKGNHDFWWSTATKINNFFEENEIKTIKLLHNNAYRLEDCIICGSRGWFYDEKQQKTVGEVDYENCTKDEDDLIDMLVDDMREGDAVQWYRDTFGDDDFRCFIRMILIKI